MELRRRKTDNDGSSCVDCTPTNANNNNDPVLEDKNNESARVLLSKQKAVSLEESELASRKRKYDLSELKSEYGSGFHCPLADCKFQSKFKVGIIMHMKSKKGHQISDRFIRNRIMGESNSNAQITETNVKESPGERQLFTCLPCNFTSPLRFGLARHLKSPSHKVIVQDEVSDEELESMDDDNDDSQSEFELSSEEEEPSDNEIFSCSRCEFKSIHRQLRDVHFQLNHTRKKTKNGINFKVVEETLTLFCIHCTFVTEDLSEMIDHWKIHDWALND